LVYLIRNAASGKAILYLDCIETFAGCGSYSGNEDGYYCNAQPLEKVKLG